jgi:protein ImuB
LVRRFGEPVTRRLDQALGRAPEPISPRRPVPARRSLLAFAEPIARADDIAAGLGRLLATLCARLERDGLGARRLELALYRIDGTVMRLGVGTSRPSRDAGHLQRLFAEHMEKIDPGFGIEAMALAALAADPIEPEQSDLEGSDAKEPECLSMLVDRLSNRLGPAAVFRLRPCESHMPERAVAAAAALGPAARASWPRLTPRPVRLLPCPEPVEAVAELPDGPPVLFRWRGAAHRVRRAEGPERIAPEWWRDAGAPEQATRDYYRIEDEQGRRFWLYRAGLYEAEAEPSWYLHGMFA